MGNLVKMHRDGDRLLQLLIFNEEFLVRHFSILSRFVRCHSTFLSPPPVCQRLLLTLLPFTLQVFNCFPYPPHHRYFSKVILPIHIVTMYCCPGICDFFVSPQRCARGCSYHYFLFNLQIFAGSPFLLHHQLVCKVFLLL